MRLDRKGKTSVKSRCFLAVFGFGACFPAFVLWFLLAGLLFKLSVPKSF